MRGEDDEIGDVLAGRSYQDLPIEEAVEGSLVGVSLSG